MWLRGGPFSMPSKRVSEWPIDNAFLKRHSPRAFSKEKITESMLLTLLEAARWAPSSLNIQPWRFVYSLRGDQAWNGLISSLRPYNHTSACSASALVVFASNRFNLPEGTEDPVPNPFHVFDTGAAWSCFSIQAAMSDWYVLPMGGFDPAAIAKNIRLPSDYSVHIVAAIGRMLDPSALTTNLGQNDAANNRRPLSETAFLGHFP